MNCHICKRRVRDTFKSKWNHVVKYHPTLFADGLFSLMRNSDQAFAFGRQLAKTVMTKTDFFKS